MRSTSVKRKRRVGRPATGQAPIIGIRASKELRSAIEKWAAKQPDQP